MDWYAWAAWVATLGAFAIAWVTEWRARTERGQLAIRVTSGRILYDPHTPPYRIHTTLRFENRGPSAVYDFQVVPIACEVTSRPWDDHGVVRPGENVVVNLSVSQQRDVPMVEDPLRPGMSYPGAVLEVSWLPRLSSSARRGALRVNEVGRPIAILRRGRWVLASRAVHVDGRGFVASSEPIRGGTWKNLVPTWVLLRRAQRKSRSGI